MRLKRLAMLLLVFMVAGAGTVFANTVYERYTAKKIVVKVNNAKLATTGLEVDIDDNQQGVQMAGIKEIVKELGGIVTSEKDTVSVYKPNVQLSVYYVKKDDSKEEFGKLYLNKDKKKNTLNLEVFAKVDSLFTDISSLKLSIRDPFGAEIASDVYNLKNHADNFWLTFKGLTYVEFKYSGNYTIQLLMKPSGDNQFIPVSQMVIESTTTDK